MQVSTSCAWSGKHEATLPFGFSLQVAAFRHHEAGVREQIGNTHLLEHLGIVEMQVEHDLRARDPGVALAAIDPEQGMHLHAETRQGFEHRDPAFVRRPVEQHVDVLQRRRLCVEPALCPTGISSACVMPCRRTSASRLRSL